MIGKLISGIIALLLAAGPARAAWVALSTADLVAQSDVIVEGNYLGTTRLTLDPTQPALLVGAVRIDRPLRGKAPGELALLVIGPADGPRVSTELRFQPGQQGIWLLRRYASAYEGLYAADHPQRFIPMAGAVAFMKTLKQLPKPPAIPEPADSAPVPPRPLMAE